MASDGRGAVAQRLGAAMDLPQQALLGQLGDVAAQRGLRRTGERGKVLDRRDGLPAERAQR